MREIQVKGIYKHFEGNYYMGNINCGLDPLKCF